MTTGSKSAALAAATLLTTLVLTCSAADAAAAGDRISNTARLTFDDHGSRRTILSNDVELVVGERLDVTLTRDGDGGPVAVAAPGTALAVTLTNAGNGSEAFDLAVTADDGSVRIRSIAIDQDGDGRFDAATDAALHDGRTPPLAAGNAVHLLIVLDPAAPVTATALTVVAHAVTGTGDAGTTFPAQGDGGGDAVTGPTGAVARLSVSIAGNAEAPTLSKAQAVRAPDGSARPVQGAIVTYTLAAHFASATADVRIADPIPAGTTYVSGSLRLDASPLSDAADGDSGTADGAAIDVTLGDIAGPSDRAVQFQVTIQ